MATRARRALILMAWVALPFLACISERPRTPVQGWWAERGPVVRHEKFPADCRLCHEGSDWRTIVDDFEFDHAGVTGMALVGAHAEAECLRCHNDRGSPASFAERGCAGCHVDVHRGQLGDDCLSCHGQSDWRARGAIERHARTRFPLVGSHAATACFRCHIGAEVGNFTRADPDCVTCHRDDLARTRMPDHLSAGFVDRCERCHVPTRWDGPGFSHPGLPLAGPHGQLSCTDCHTASFSTFTCTDCHAHTRRDMDDEHDDVEGYLYSTPACYACHPDGRE